MNLTRKITLSIALAASLGAAADVVTYPAGQGVETTEDYSVAVRQGGSGWEPVAVYPVKVDEVRGTKHCVELASMAYFDFSGTVEVRVVHNRGAVEAARVRPLSQGIKPSVQGDTLTFSLSRPANLSVEVNGDIFHNLHLFASPLDARRPSAKEIKRAGRKGSKLVYFAPGVHRLPGDTLRVASGSTVYVDGGARVLGTLIVDGERDVRIYGRGEVHPAGRGAGVYVKRSKKVEAEGIIVTQLPVGQSDSVAVTNVKAISSYGWGDGMNAFASSNVRYDSVFCRNSDDCSTIYATRMGFKGSCKNILMENSTLWADVAHPIMIGIHGNVEEPDTIENITYRNIDILDHQERQLDYQGCFAINCGDENLIRDLVFDNIRVEDFRLGRLVDIRIFYNKKYCLAPGRGIHNVLFKDIVYNGGRSELSIIAGYDDSRKVSGITFDNLVINGVRITDDMPGKPRWYKTGDMARIFIGEHVDGVVFK